MLGNLREKICAPIAWCVWGYLLLVLCCVVLLRLAGEQWWLATILLFSPRWLFLLPLLLFAPLAAVYNRLLFSPLLLTAIVLLVSFMGFNFPVSSAVAAKTPETQVLRILTLNIDNGKCDTSQLEALIKGSAFDLVALQEYPDSIKLLLPSGWHTLSERGLAVISRFPMERGKVVQLTPARSIWPGTYLLQTVIHAPGGDVAFCSLQLPTPRFGLQRILDRYTFINLARKNILVEDTDYRWRVAQEIQRYLATLTLPVIVAGDFNTPPDSPLYRQLWGGFGNAFSKAGLGFGWTQRVSIHGLPFNIRIDHILTGKGLTPLLSMVGPDVGSDHLPLIADIRRDSKQ